MEGSNYNQIAKDYHMKRKKPWRPLEFFLNDLKDKGYTFNGKSLDLGCANGRNFNLINTPPNKLIGIDISLELIKIAYSNLKDKSQYSQFESKFFQLIVGDITYLPFRTNSIDNVFTIASIHHIKKKSIRKSTIAQIFKLLRKDGFFILTVWRKWQKRFRNYFISEWVKRKFIMNYQKHQESIGLVDFGDKFVPWTLSKEEKIYNRFYHFFSKKELIKLLKNYRIIEFKITGGPSDRDNFFIFAQKSIF